MTDDAETSDIRIAPTAPTPQTADGDDLPTWECMASWTEAEWEYWCMGPFDGGIPGFVRRVRRILDVSQRGLAAMLGVSQSVVARWETGRTSPRTSVFVDLLRRARLRMQVSDRETGVEVPPMREDGATKHGGSRFPAHTDLRTRGWHVPRAHRDMTTVDYFRSIRRSRERRDPAISFRLSRRVKALERRVWGTPDDHPAVHQFAAEAEYLDELRAERRRYPAAGYSTTPYPTTPYPTT